MNSPRHIPVMLNEVLDTLKPEAGKIYVDATFGNGGYSEAILKTVNCTVIAIDRDPTVRTRAEEIKKLYGNRFEFITGTFGDIAQLIKQPVDGVVFDIGVSSSGQAQLVRKHRLCSGHSFTFLQGCLKLCLIQFKPSALLLRFQPPQA